MDLKERNWRIEKLHDDDDDDDDREEYETSCSDLFKVLKLSLYLITHHAMKMYCGSGGIAPCILNFGTRWS